MSSRPAGAALIAALLGQLAACTPEETPTDSDTAAVTDTGEALSLVATWTMAEAEAALLDGMGRGLPDPATVNDWFFGLIQREETMSPECYTITGDEDEGWVSEWQGECTSEDGYAFLGGWLYRDEADFSETSSSRDMRLLASFHVVDPEGQVTTGGGEMTMTTMTALPDAYSINVDMGGIYEAPDQTGWLGDGVGTGFSLDASRGPEGLLGTLDGGLTHDDELTLYFDEISWSAACGEVPMGTIRIRDPSSLWYYYDFGETCDGCASVTLQGEALGQSCIGDDIYQSIQAALDRILP